MTINYVNAFWAFGLSSDAKPTNVPEGLMFIETDSQKLYVFAEGAWKETKSGSGVWSATAAETLQNKEIVVNQNTVRTTSGNIGIFGFGNTGQYVFVPKGSANQYLKVNSGASGFEWGDPASTGSWNPTSTETLENKTIDVQKNPIKRTTPTAGSLLLDNGTRFLPLDKGSIGQALKVKSDGTVGWDTDATGGGSGTASSLPSQTGYFEGSWHGKVGVSYYEGRLLGTTGLFMDEIYIENYTSDTPTEGFSTVRGRYANFPVSTSSSYGHMKSSYLFARDFSSSYLCKFRFSNTTAMNGLFGFISYLPAQFTTSTVFNNYDVLAFGKVTTYTNWQIYNNAATATATRTDTGVAFDTNPHTVELKFDAPNNRIGWRLHGSTYDPNAAWNYLSSNIARAGSTLAMFFSINGTTTGTNNLEVYDVECRNKVMF